MIKLPMETIVPDHIAMVLDGNRRWARAKGLPPWKGHMAGYLALDKLAHAVRKMGVHTFTVWAFSTENWQRPKKEIDEIMKIFRKALKETEKDFHKERVALVHLGRKDRLPKDIQRELIRIEAETAKYKNKHVFNLAVDYGGRDEIIRALQKIVDDQIQSHDITEETITSYLDTANQPYPNPDLFIRTSGEQRTSGLLPWQLVYSEYYFEDGHLPDFTPEKLRLAILDYSRRRRRFGANDKEKHLEFKPEITAGLELAWWRLGKIPEGTRFRDYALNHIAEQYGLSKKLAGHAAKYFVQAIVEGNDNKWAKSKKSIHEFYELIKEELKLAFEPKVVAKLQVKLWKDLQNEKSIEKALGAEDTAKELYAEVYRISLFQAAKLAHLRVLASVERNLALAAHSAGSGSSSADHHWSKAEDYLQRFYRDLKERVA